MKTFTKFIVAVLFALIWFGEIAESAPILEDLDQQQSVTTGNFTAFTALAARSLAQTFTANKTGLLSYISIYTNNGSNNSIPVKISILGTTAGIPNATVLWSGNFTGLQNDWVDLATSGPMITAGNVYAISMESSVASPPLNTWVTKRDENLYLGGSLFEKRDLGWVTVTSSSIPYESADAAFKTYVTVIPELSTSLLIIFSLMSTLFLKRRFRSTS